MALHQVTPQSTQLLIEVLVPAFVAFLCTYDLWCGRQV